MQQTHGLHLSNEQPVMGDEAGLDVEKIWHDPVPCIRCCSAPGQHVHNVFRGGWMMVLELAHATMRVNAPIMVY